MGAAATQRYFRRWKAGEDPAQLLDPAHQWSMLLGTPVHGPCVRCRSARLVEYHCCACLQAPLGRACPACAGLIQFVDVCPVCEGAGTIGRPRRRGVSVFPTADGLYRYIAEQDVDGDDCIVELEGPLSGDRDLDADAGALLILPTRVVATHPFQLGRLAAVRMAIEV
jgi:hypothetical protein